MLAHTERARSQHKMLGTQQCIAVLEGFNACDHTLTHLYRGMFLDSVASENAPSYLLHFNLPTSLMLCQHASRMLPDFS